MTATNNLPHIYTGKTLFHINGVEHEPWLDGLLNLPKGTGVLWSDGKRYRVVDSWFSFDHHGFMGTGLHVFLETAKPSDDRPKKMNPDYFANEDEGTPVVMVDAAALRDANDFGTSRDW